jgi:indole-3-glycerol phosphate synthase
MGTYLDSIVAWHRQRSAADDAAGRSPLERRKEAERLAEHRLQRNPIRDFRTALASPGLSVIAEIKRRSPSKGDLAASLDPALTAKRYEAGGASCLSVLTDSEHCETDIVEAVAMGADCVLLIVAALSDQELTSLSSVAAAFNMPILWETHDELEVSRALEHGATIVGVNQRDLHTFRVDQERAVRVGSSIPNSVIRVAESGVRGPADAAVLCAAGYDAVLVGESLVTSSDTAQAVADLIAQASR